MNINHFEYNHGVQNIDLLCPVPVDAGTVRGWKQVPIKEGGEPLVSLGSLSSEAGNIFTSSVYFGEHNNSPYILDVNKVQGSSIALFARASVAEKLQEAQSILPDGMRLIAFDAYRPLEVQASLYDFYRSRLALQLPDVDATTLEEETQKYVSVPSRNPSMPSPHNTGASVDLAIIKFDKIYEKKLEELDTILNSDSLSYEERVSAEMRRSAIIRHHGVMLNFGTSFDHGGEKAALAYFDRQIEAGKELSSAEIEACYNRRILYNAMSKVGMVAFESEWWHYNAPESQMGARAIGLHSAMFGGTELSRENRVHLQKRLELHELSTHIQESLMRGLGARAIHTSLDKTIHDTLLHTGEPRIGGDWKTEIIAPQFESVPL